MILLLRVISSVVSFFLLCECRSVSFRIVSVCRSRSIYRSDHCAPDLSCEDCPITRDPTHRSFTPSFRSCYTIERRRNRFNKGKLAVLKI